MKAGKAPGYWLSLATTLIILFSGFCFIQACASQTTTSTSSASAAAATSPSEAAPTTAGPTTTEPSADGLVKGLYVPPSLGYDAEGLAALIGIADETEVNAFVLDVKDGLGRLTYNADVALVRELGLADADAEIDTLLSLLEEHHITPIARIECFRDSGLAGKRRDLAVKSKSSGDTWKDPGGITYLDPYNREVWEYLTEIAEDAIGRGFREVQFSSVQFPSSGSLEDAVYPAENGTQEDAIAGFLGFARARLTALGAPVSVGVYGVVVSQQSAIGGQSLERMAEGVDLFCPLVFPSQYQAGSYGLDQPGTHPRELVSSVLEQGNARLVGTAAKIRPWLQAFTFGSLVYGSAEIRAQIRAATEQGSSGWVLYNPSGEYVQDAFALD